MFTISASLSVCLSLYLYLHLFFSLFLSFSLSIYLSLSVSIRKRPKFRFGSGFGWFWPVRFGKNVAELLPNFLAFNFVLTYIVSIKRTDYAILCNKSFSQSQHNATYLDNYVLRCKNFGSLRVRILYSCLD